MNCEQKWSDYIRLSDILTELYLEQGVDYQDVEHILQRDDHTVEN